MDVKELQNMPVYQKLTPEKKQIITDLLKEANNTPMDKSLPLLLKTNARMKALGISFTKEETSLLLDVLMKDMTPAERSRFEAVRKLILKP